MIPGSANPLLLGQDGAGGYEIERSLRFNSGDSSFLNRTPSSAGNRRTWTWSGWVKKAKNGANQMLFSSGSGGTNARSILQFTSSDVIEFGENPTGSAWSAIYTNAVYRDPSAWYHVVAVYDSTNATSTDRLRLYVNGVRVDSFSSSSYPSQNLEGNTNTTDGHRIGRYSAGNEDAYLDGYLADVHFIDGQALAATDFGETNTDNLWVPIAYAGTYGWFDNSQTWSNDVTGTPYGASYSAEKAFDGNFSTRSTGGSTGLTFTPSSAITVNSSLRVYFGYADSSATNVFSVNGTDYSSLITTSGSNVGWITVPGITSLTSLYYGLAPSGSEKSSVSAIEIDGKILIDSGVTVADNSFHLDFADNSSDAALGTDTSGNSNTWTVNNLSTADGAAVTVSTATNALPIRNTTGAQGGTAASGFRTDANASNLFLALPLNSNTSDVSNSINSYSATKSITNQSTATSSSQSRFYGASSYWNANSDGILVAESGSELVVGTGDFTIELWFYDDSNHSGGGSGRCYLFDNRIGGSVVGDPPSIGGYVDGSTHIRYGSTGGTITSSQATDGVNNKWFHFAAVRNSGTTTLYINGSSVGSHSDTTNYPNNGFGIGRATDGGYGWAGYIQDFRVYKTAKYTSNFTIPAEANPTVGAANDSLVDTPTNGATASDTGLGNQITSNYATLNPLGNIRSTNANVGEIANLSNGNLTCTGVTSKYGHATSTIAIPSSGKYYFEVTSEATSDYINIGIASTVGTITGVFETSTDSHAAWYDSSGKIKTKVPSGGTVTVSTVTEYRTTGGTIGVAVDVTNQEIKFYLDGTLKSTLSSLPTALISKLTAGEMFAYITAYNSAVGHINFGQRVFSHPVSGYKSLNTANLSSTIADGSLYFDTKLWTGNGSTQSITGLNFSPDFVWIKNRGNAADHRVYDTVRGALKEILPNDTTAETTRENSVTAFNSDGYSLGSYGGVNNSGTTAVGWAWDAGSSNTTIAAGTAVTNQAQTWSSNITTTGNSGNWYPSYPATNIFDTTTTNYGHANGDGSVSAVVTLSFSPAITCGSSVSFYGGLTGSGTGTISINGGTAFNLTTGSSATTKTTVAFNGSISSIVVTKTATGGQGLLMYGFEVDGTRLVDGTAFNSVAVPSIASTVRANPSAGFSIVSYTGTGTTGTIGHNLNSKPELIIVKNRTNSSDWYIFGDAIDSTYDERLTLNSTVAKDSSTSAMNATAPTSSVFTVGGNAGTNGSGTNIIAYCFAPVEGYSAMGSYTGNGSSTDGPFVYTGHSVAWVMIKRSDAVDNWVIYDVARDTYNIGGRRLYPDLSGGETQNVSHYIDILSNGFKVHSTGGMLNASGGTYIYIAFASNPFASNGGLAR